MENVLRQWIIQYPLSLSDVESVKKLTLGNLNGSTTKWKMLLSLNVLKPSIRESHIWKPAILARLLGVSKTQTKAAHQSGASSKAEHSFTYSSQLLWWLVGLKHLMTLTVLIYIFWPCIECCTVFTHIGQLWNRKKNISKLVQSLNSEIMNQNNRDFNILGIKK